MSDDKNRIKNLIDDYVGLMVDRTEATLRYRPHLAEEIRKKAWDIRCDFHELIDNLENNKADLQDRLRKDDMGINEFEIIEVEK